MTVLETKDLGITFGGLKALDDVYIRIDEKEIVGPVSYTHLGSPEKDGKTVALFIKEIAYVEMPGM